MSSKGPAKLKPKPAPAPKGEWTCGPIELRGLHVFTHIIRAPDDPERRPREERKGMQLAWKKIRQSKDIAKFKDAILQVLSDGSVRTFNNITTTLFDETADMHVDGPVNQALWELVGDCELEHTSIAPIYFRRRATKGRARAKASSDTANTGAPAELVAGAKHVDVLVNGSKNSVAALLWTLQQGRLDATVVFRTGEGCDLPVTRSYVEALAKTFRLGFRATASKTVMAKKGAVVVSGHRKRPGNSKLVTPFAGKTDAEVWAELDHARVRPHPTYVLGVSDPCPAKGVLEKTAQRTETTTLERALAQAAVESGVFPPDFVLFDEGQKRER